jgi:hypothetical protein
MVAIIASRPEWLVPYCPKGSKLLPAQVLRQEHIDLFIGKSEVTAIEVDSGDSLNSAGRKIKSWT